MNAMKMKLIEELMSHISSMQGNDLKSRFDESKKPILEEGSPEEEATESPKEEMMEDGKPKGLAIEKVSILGKPKGFDDKANEAIQSMSDDPKEDMMPGETEMTDDELEELLKQLTSKG